MSNIIPPLVSSSPPPMVAGELDELEDEFGDFTAATDLSFEGYSLPSTPQHTPFSNISPISHQNIPQRNNILTEDYLPPDLHNGQPVDNFQEIKEYKISSDSSENYKHLFCDINSDVNIKTSVNNNENQNDIKRDFKPNITPIVQKNIDSEETIEEIQSKTTDYCDTNNEKITNSSQDLQTSKYDKENKSETNFTELFSQTREDDFGDFNCFSTSKDFNKETIETVVTNCEENNVNCRDCSNCKELEKVIKNDSIINEEETVIGTKVLINKNEKETALNNFENSIQTDEIINENKEEATDKVKNLDKELNKTKADLQFNAKTEFEDLNFIASVENSQIFDDSSRKENICEAEEEFENFNFDFSREKTEIIHAEEISQNFDSKTKQQDKFEDFSCISSSEQTVIKQIEETSICKENNTSSIDEEEFGEFDSPLNKNTFENMVENVRQDETKFCEENKTSTEEEDELGKFTFSPDTDDFGDFNEYSTQEQVESLEFPVNFGNSSSANAEKIINDCFMGDDKSIPESEVVDFMNNAIFKKVQDIENTNALSYQWANSESQKTLLKSLNIDSRNILYGPRWNASMPRFAANLGFTPLEPVKSEIVTPALPQVVSATPPEQSSCEVPAAKFDWISAGLVNPLDYSPANTMLLDLEHFVPSLDINPDSPSHYNPENIDLVSWDLWLQMQASETAKAEIIEDKLSLNQSDVKHLDLNILNNFGSDTESVNSLKFMETPVEIENEIKLETDKSIVVSDDSFTSFQSSETGLKLPLRESYISLTENHTVKNIELESTILTPELSRKSVQEVEEDDFAEFQVGLPQPEKLKKEFVVSVPLEPLKPIVLEPIVNNIPTQINWPEPGVVNENFDFSFTNSQEKREEKIKSAAAEEDDWSDFVCAPKKPTNSLDNFSNLFQNMSNQVSQLELSVPNLQNAQLTHNTAFPPSFVPTSPAKSVNLPPSTQQIAAQQIGQGYQPPYQIPLQTMNTLFGGLPQTTLSTYNFTIGPTVGPTELPMQERKNTSGFGIFDGPFNPEIKPFQPTNPVQTSSNDDDDWSDFVSSQPAPNSNGFTNVQQHTNIISNPGHFEAFQSYQPNKDYKTSSKKVGSVQMKNKNSVPSISALPDLDFIAPKNKFFSKK